MGQRSASFCCGAQPCRPLATPQAILRMRAVTSVTSCVPDHIGETAGRVKPTNSGPRRASFGKRQVRQRRYLTEATISCFLQQLGHHWISSMAMRWTPGRHSRPLRIHCEFTSRPCEETRCQYDVKQLRQFVASPRTRSLRPPPGKDVGKAFCHVPHHEQNDTKGPEHFAMQHASPQAQQRMAKESFVAWKARQSSKKEVEGIFTTASLWQVAVSPLQHVVVPRKGQPSTCPCTL